MKFGTDRMNVGHFGVRDLDTLTGLMPHGVERNWLHLMEELVSNGIGAELRALEAEVLA